ncbi:MAG: hypothetical protein OXC91_05620 [Rhodobacteraceae bacterium]|nr:hypothetical protein [Paracoccaceae bacterium]
MGELDFSISVEPALTLADTRISAAASGTKISGPTLEDAGGLWRILGAWVTAHYPNRVEYAYGGDYVPTRLVVVNDRVAPKVTLAPIAIGHRVVDNSDSDIPQEASVDFSATVGGEASVSWSESVTAGVEFTIGLEVGSEFAKTSASTSYSLSTTVGHDTSQSHSFSVSTTEGDRITVPPGQIALMVGLVQKGTLTFAVDMAYRPETYAHAQVGTILRSDNPNDLEHAHRQWFTLDGSQMAPFCGGILPVTSANIQIPFASEVVTKVVAPLASDSPLAIDKGIRQAIEGLNG